MPVNRAAIIYHPVKTPEDRLRLAVANHEREHGWGESLWFPTSAEDAGRQAAQDALAAEPAVIIVAGGDGTVRAAVEAVQGTGVPLALLPAGTGNLLARNLDLPLNDLERSVAVAFSGVTRVIDVAEAELEDENRRRDRHVFAVMAGIGLDAAMAQNTSALAKKHLGWLAYVTPIARSIIANRLFHLRYRVDGGRIGSERAHTVIVGNCGTLTGNMLLMPKAVIDDGLLDVVMLRPRGFFGWTGIGTRLTFQGLANLSRFGKSVLDVTPDIRALAYAQGREFTVRFEAPHHVELDGDTFGPIVGARIRVVPGALRVCVPGDAS